MSWEIDEIATEIADAHQRDDFAEFERLLKEHPECILAEYGGDMLLSTAVGLGQLNYVKLLIVLGADVNWPLYSSEKAGAICSAASEGHLELVRWLLDHGAKINFDEGPHGSCRVLVHAAMNGHLDVVKLLVERGANINGRTGGRNAMMYAEMRGHNDVADYLLQMGSEDLKKTPPDFPASHERIGKRLANIRGELGPLKIIDEGEPVVTIQATTPSEEWDSQTLFTTGMSDIQLTLPDGDMINMELMLMLPPDWPLDDDALADPKWNWPITWLRKLAREALDAGTWPDARAAVFPNGRPPKPFAKGTKLCTWLCMPGQDQYQMPDFRWVDIRAMFAIYKEEQALVEKEGPDALLERFRDRNLPMYVDLKRPNMAVKEKTKRPRRKKSGG